MFNSNFTVYDAILHCLNIFEQDYFIPKCQFLSRNIIKFELAIAKKNGS